MTEFDKDRLGRKIGWRWVAGIEVRAPDAGRLIPNVRDAFTISGFACLSYASSTCLKP